MEGNAKYYKRDFWETENLNYTEPHYRMRKVAAQVCKLAGDRELDLLDVGCGPGALARLLPSSVRYHGIDIAIHSPASNLVELDIVETPIAFKGMTFDIIVAQGLFEYLGDVQSQKLAEIAALLKPGGRFVCTYQNFAHWRRNNYWPYSNMQMPEDFRKDLSQYFTILQAFPTAYNLHHLHPNRKFVRVPQERMTVNIPVIGRLLAIDYYYLCTALRSS